MVRMEKQRNRMPLKMLRWTRESGEVYSGEGGVLLHVHHEEQGHEEAYLQFEQEEVAYFGGGGLYLDFGGLPGNGGERVLQFFPK